MENNTLSTMFGVSLYDSDNEANIGVVTPVNKNEIDEITFIEVMKFRWGFYLSNYDDLELSGETELERFVNWCNSLKTGRVIEIAPFIFTTILCDSLINSKYDPNFGDDKICECGHSYYRHFDPYENMENVGCKYCGCTTFIEKTN